MVQQFSSSGSSSRGIIKTNENFTENPTALRAAPAIAAAPPAQKEFAWPPSVDQDACFTRVLYRSYNKKRLPVFKEICPD